MKRRLFNLLAVVLLLPVRVSHRRRQLRNIIFIPSCGGRWGWKPMGQPVPQQHAAWTFLLADRPSATAVSDGAGIGFFLQSADGEGTVFAEHARPSGPAQVDPPLGAI
jgi:hypothetical protein